MAIDPTTRPGYKPGRCGAWCNRGAPFAEWFPCGQFPMANGRCARHGGRGHLRAGWHKGRTDNGRLGKRKPKSIVRVFNKTSRKKNKGGRPRKHLKAGRHWTDQYKPQFPWHWLPRLGRVDSNWLREKILHDPDIPSDI